MNKCIEILTSCMKSHMMYNCNTLDLQQAACSMSVQYSAFTFICIPLPFHTTLEWTAAFALSHGEINLNSIGI
jgi:hypothetical protein